MLNFKAKMEDNLILAIAESITFDALTVEEAKQVDISEKLRAISWPHDDQPFSIEYLDDPYELTLEDYFIKDVSGIETQEELEVLSIPASTLSDLTPIKELKNLKSLCVGVTDEADLSVLKECLNLKRVFINSKPNEDQQMILQDLMSKGIHVDVLNEIEFNTAPFEDPILKLAVLNSLQEIGEFHWPELYAFDDYCLDMYNLQRVINVDIDQAKLDRIEELYWTGGGLDIHHLLYPQWHGETEEYDIKSLKGLELLKNLKRLTVEQPDNPKHFGQFRHLME
ncbi:MAG: hypothetical protein MRY83_12005 [Flavobacteriales bacterium]|nr:hypothetical protein [Flavobacteriales bacterium]